MELIEDHSLKRVMPQASVVREPFSSTFTFTFTFTFTKSFLLQIDPPKIQV